MTTPLNIALYAPRIPQNTGQIGRACLAMGCRLHLVRPLGFRVDAAALRRASVGHLAELDMQIHADGEALWQTIGDPGRAWLVTKFGRARYDEVNYAPGDWFIFGNETEGLPPRWLDDHAGRTLRIPMARAEARCLNLATAASAVMFEALRQIGFAESPIPERTDTDAAR